MVFNLVRVELKCVTPKAIKSQALANLLTYFPSKNLEPLKDRIPGDELQENLCEKGEEWILEYDESSLAKIGGVGVMLSSEKKYWCYCSNWISHAPTMKPSMRHWGLGY